MLDAIIRLDAVKYPARFVFHLRNSLGVKSIFNFSGLNPSLIFTPFVSAPPGWAAALGAAVIGTMLSAAKRLSDRGLLQSYLPIQSGVFGFRKK